MNEITARNTSLFVDIIFANDNYTHTTPTLSNKPLPSENGGEEREKSTIVRLSITMETRHHEKGNFCSKKEIPVRKRKFLTHMTGVRARVSIAQFSPSLLHHFRCAIHQWIAPFTPFLVECISKP
jgi:hypothetical protein